MTGSGPDIEDSDLGCFVDETTTMTDCLVDGVFGAGPAPSLMGLLMSGVLLTTLYIAGDGSIIVPSVITILLGSAMIPILPAQFVTLAYTVVVIGITAAIFGAWSRFTTPGGFQ